MQDSQQDHDHDPRFVVEVAAMLGDSVIEVKHLSDPRGGRVTAATGATLAAGVGLLALSAFAFAHGVAVARSDQRSLRTWIDAGERPVSEFRPQRMSRNWDLLAFGGAAAGVAFLVAGLGQRRRQLASPTFRIGRAAGVDFPLDALGDAAALDTFDLVSPRAGEFVLRVPPGMSLHRVTSVGPLPATDGEAVLSADARYLVDGGAHRFAVASVPAPRRQSTPIFAATESAVVAFFAGSLLCHLALVALLRTVPPDGRGLDDDAIATEGRLTLARVAPPEPHLDVPLDGDGDGQGLASGPESRAGQRMALTEGAMGIATAHSAGLYQIERRREQPALAHSEAIRRAAQAGILGSYQGRQMFASLTGSADLASGHDAADVYGGLVGLTPGEATGIWGNGITGVGPGGGGTGWGTLGSGDYGLIGYAGTCDAGCIAGMGGQTRLGHGLRQHRSSGPVVDVGKASAVGELDPNIIRRYIRRKLPAVRHCYEARLLTAPELSGTVLTQFQISPTGVVQGAVASGMNDREVESCVADAIGAIQFPAPRGGGMVNVRYPFTFQPAG